MSIKILRSIIETRLEGEHIEYRDNPIDIIDEASANNKVDRIRNNLYFTTYKTVYKNEEGILMTFMVKDSTGEKGVVNTNDVIMNLVGFLEKNLDVRHMYYDQIKEKKKDISFLNVIINPNEEELDTNEC